MPSSPPPLRPQTFEEKTIWYYLTWTYPLFFVGIHATVAPLVAWVLALYAGFKRWSQTDATPAADKIRVPIGVWVWFVGISLVQVAIVMSHIDYDLGMNQMIRTSINAFLKNWILFALFPLVASCLKIRPQILFRAVCILCVQSLIMVVVCSLCQTLKIPLPEYSSPVERLSGSPYIALSVPEPIGGETRLALFAPWPPALGLVGAMYLWICLLEPSLKWKVLGLAGTVAMITASGSRTGQICLTAVPAVTFALSWISRPIAQLAAGVGAFFVGAFGPQVFLFFQDWRRSVNQQRAGSTRVRRALFNASVYRWRTEAFWWGHGTPSSGPATTTFKPLGSHNTWAGLLYVNGLVGACGLAIPMLWSFGEFLVKSQRSRVALGALGALIVLGVYSSSENMDQLVYLHWPGLVLIGFAHKERLPFLSAQSPAPPDSSPAEASAATSTEATPI